MPNTKSHTHWCGFVLVGQGDDAEHKTTPTWLRGCRFMCGRVKKRSRTRKNTNKGVVSSSVDVVGRGKDVEHKTTPMLVLFCVRRVWEAFVNKGDDEETLLVMITVDYEVKKN